MHEPIHARDEDTAEECSQRPQSAADEKGIAPKMPRHLGGIGINRERESDMDDGGQNPNSRDPHKDKTAGKETIHIEVHGRGCEEGSGVSVGPSA